MWCGFLRSFVDTSAMSSTSTDAGLPTRRSTHALLGLLTNGRPSLAYEALLDITGEYRRNDKHRDVYFSTLLDDTIIEMTMSGRGEDAHILRNLCDTISSTCTDHSILLFLLVCARNIRKRRRVLPLSFFGSHVALSAESQSAVSHKRLSEDHDAVANVFCEPQNIVDTHHTDRNGSLTLRSLSSKDRFDCIADAARFTLEQRSLWLHKRLSSSRSAKNVQNPLSINHSSAKAMLDSVKTDYDNFHRIFKPLPTASMPSLLEHPPSTRDIELLHLVLSRCITGSDSEDVPTLSPGAESRPALVRTYLHNVEDVHPDARRAHIYRRMCIRRRQYVMGLRQSQSDSSSDFVTGLMTRASRCGAVYCDIASFTECYSNATRHRILRAVADFAFKVAHNYFQTLLAVTIDESIFPSNKPFAVVQSAESFISDGTILADILGHVEETDGSSVVIMNLLMAEATQHPSNEMVQLLFCASISAYFNIVWDWFFEGSVRRDTYTDFFGTVLGLSPEASEMLENAQSFDVRIRDNAGLYPDLFSREDALFILRAGRGRRLLCSFNQNRGVLAMRPDDIDFANSAVCFDDVEKVLSDLADRVRSSFAAVDDDVVSSTCPFTTSFVKNDDFSLGNIKRWSSACDTRTPELSGEKSSENPAKHELSKADIPGSNHNVSSGASVENGDGFIHGTPTAIMMEHDVCRELLSLEATTGNKIILIGESEQFPQSPTSASIILEDLPQDNTETLDSCKPALDTVKCAHKDNGPDIDHPLLSPTCVRCTAFQVPEASSNESCTSFAEAINIFSKVVDETLPKAEDALQKVMPRTRQKSRFPLPAMMSTQLLAPLRRIDGVVQKVVLHYFVSELRLIDHLRTLRAHALLGAGDFANELLVQLDAASLVADTSERFMHRHATGAASYGNDSTGDWHARNQTQLNHCLRTALNLYTTEPNPLADLIQLHSGSSSTDRSDEGRRISTGHAQFWQEIIVRYDVPHPLNVIITEESMGRYSRIFDLFLRILRARKSLRSLFLTSRRTRACGKALRQNREFAEKIWNFCWHAEHFVSIFGGFEMEQVLGNCWTEFEKGWSTAKSIWELRDSHRSFLDGCARRCLLGEKHRSVLKVMTGGFEIVVNVDREITKLGLADVVSGSREMHNVMDLLVSATASLKRRCAFLTDVLERLLESGTLPHLEHLLTQLNFNFYFQKVTSTAGAAVRPEQQSILPASQLWQTSQVGEMERT